MVGLEEIRVKHLGTTVDDKGWLINGYVMMSG